MALMQYLPNRRCFLAEFAAAGAASLVGAPRLSLAELPPETTSVRFVEFPGGVCTAPQYVAEGLLRNEGFSDFSYVPIGTQTSGAVLIAEGKADFALDFATAVVVALDAGAPVKVLTGIHNGCYELFAHEGINRLPDLKDKSVGVGPVFGGDPQLLVTAMATYVGLDPQRDIKWIVSDVPPVQLFAEHKIDAMLAILSEVQELRARKLGRVVISAVHDKPWSEHYCCMLVASADYVERHPVATKRIARAVLKGADLCASAPDTAARLLIDSGVSDNYEYAAQALAEMSYARWREFDPEDSIRFFALRMHEAGTVKANPQELIARGVDWRFLNELKRELKT
jgi:NitT/TauT family transport system substrate-binding protein